MFFFLKKQLLIYKVLEVLIKLAMILNKLFIHALNKKPGFMLANDLPLKESTF